MKTIIAILLVAFALAGCASLGGNLTIPGTDTQITCESAQRWVDMSQLELDRLKEQGIVKGDAVTYWSEANFGARLWLMANGCGGTK